MVDINRVDRFHSSIMFPYIASFVLHDDFFAVGIHKSHMFDDVAWIFPVESTSLSRYDEYTVAIDWLLSIFF
jgi:hypothetical protein